jgi:hypothetical protein
MKGRLSLLVGAVLFTTIGLLDPAAQAETKLECTARIAALVSKGPLVQEKAGAFFVPAEALKQNPLLLRNLIVTAYNHPYLASFFRGLVDAPVSLHYLEKSYELPTKIQELDQQGLYSFEELVQLIRSLDSRTDRVFDLDFSRAEKEGVYLRFLDLKGTRGKDSEGELRNRKQFADALLRKLAHQTAPIPPRSFKYTRAGRSFFIEEAFFLSRASDEMQKLVVSELALPSWKMFQQPFARRVSQRPVSIRLPNGSAFDLTFMQRRPHPQDQSQFLYEVTSENGFDGELMVEGQQVEWHRRDQGASLGIVALPDLGTRKSLRFEIRSVGHGRSEATVSLEPASAGKSN